MIDLHAHLLPGIDDGAADLKETLTMLRHAREDGVDVVCATPHILRGVNERKIIALHEGFEAVKEASKGSGVELLLGAEVYLHAELGHVRYLREVTINGTGKYLLVEFPMDRIPPYADDLLSELLSQGIVPILAHPERNLSLLADPSRLESFLWMGTLAQVNVGSLVGKFGRRPAKTARHFLRNSWVHILASDAHDSGRHSICLSQGAKIAAEIVGQKAAHQLVVTNPQRIVEGKGVEMLSVAAEEKRPHGRIWNLWRNIPKSRGMR